jgi:nucleoside-diphosphate-sugar epimerase
MIIGNGLIANAFRNSDSDEVVFFASGVSNSLETNENQFIREENLIRKTIRENHGKNFVYFSTCSIYDSSKNSSFYVNHKLNMEHLVASECENYLIARASNAVGKGGNPNTLINYFVDSIQNQKPINVHIHATRNLIDVEDVVKIVLEIIESKNLNRIVNVAYLSNYSPMEIISALEKHLNEKAILNLSEKGQNYSVDIPEVESYFIENNLWNKENYLKNMLSKYY